MQRIQVVVINWKDELNTKSLSAKGVFNSAHKITLKSDVQHWEHGADIPQTSPQTNWAALTLPSTKWWCKYTDRSDTSHWILACPLCEFERPAKHQKPSAGLSDKKSKNETREQLSRESYWKLWIFKVWIIKKCIPWPIRTVEYQMDRAPHLHAMGLASQSNDVSPAGICKKDEATKKCHK